MAQQTRTTKIIFVCLGNICRSPMAEYLAKDIAKRTFSKLNVVFSSAGTAGFNDGEAAHEGTKQELLKHDIDCSGFVSKKLTKELVDDNDWIIVMDKQNAIDVKQMFGTAVDKKLLLVTNWLVDLAYSEVPDPWYTHDFHETYLILNEAINGMLQKLATTSTLH